MLKNFLIVALFYFLIPINVFGFKIDPGNSGKDTIIFKGKNIKLGGSPTASEGLDPYSYEWKSDNDGFTSNEANPIAAPSSTTVYTVTVKDGDGFKCEKSIKVIVVEIKLKTLEFKSDHNVICNGGSVVDVGSRFPDIEWNPSTSDNAPITQTASATDRIKIELTFEIKNLPDNTKVKVIGNSSENALNFEIEDVLSSGSNVKLVIIASNPIEDKIRRFESSIAWKIIIKKSEVDLGNTGPHKVYTTVSTPDISGGSQSTVPNVPRMELSVPKVADAINATGSLCFPGIVWELNKRNGNYYLGHNFNDDVRPWLLPTLPNGSDCITICKFVRNVCKVMGIPGTFDAKTYYALYATPSDPIRPNKALVGALGRPHVQPGNMGVPLNIGLDPNWVLALADRNCLSRTNPASSPGQVGCSRGCNAFEAALVYNYLGKTYYIPGGTDEIYDNQDHIVQIFQTLVWVIFGDDDGDPSTRDEAIVQSVDFTYIAQPSIRPCP